MILGRNIGPSLAMIFPGIRVPKYNCTFEENAVTIYNGARRIHYQRYVFWSIAKSSNFGGENWL